MFSRVVYISYCPPCHFEIVTEEEEEKDEEEEEEEEEEESGYSAR